MKEEEFVWKKDISCIDDSMLSNVTLSIKPIVYLKLYILFAWTLDG